MKNLSIIIVSSLFLVYCGRSPAQFGKFEVENREQTELSEDQTIEVPKTDLGDEHEESQDIPQIEIDLSRTGRYSVETHVNLCDNNWIDASQLQIGPEKPTDLSGDTFAAYGLFTMERKNLNSKYVFKIRGKMPEARFVSFETYHKYTQNKVDQIYDYEIMNADRMESMENYAGIPYEVFITDDGVDPVPGAHNIKFPKAGLLLGKQNMSMFYRVYAPTDGEDIQRKDLPRVYAYDAETGEAAECPEPYQSESFILNQKHVDLVKGSQHKTDYPFVRAPSWFDRFGFGGNSAVPWYVLEFNKLFDDSVSIIKFKAPSYSGQSYVDSPQVRYWSLCAQDIANNITMGCVPDQFAKPDTDGFVTIVYSKANDALQRKVSDLGYKFLPDIRNEDQNTIGFNYRNLFPNNGFESDMMYQRDYLPKVRTCSVSEFLNDSLSQQRCGI